MTGYKSLKDALCALYGEGVEIRSRIPVSGGDINRAYRITLSDGHILFMKENTASNSAFFEAETEGLEAIRKTAAISVPEVLAFGADERNSFLLMECIDSAARRRDFFEDFGFRLKAMHSADCREYCPSGKYGFINDNYIGAGYQENSPEDSWIEFFRNHRLLPQLKRAGRYFDKEDLVAIDHLLDKLDELLTEPDKPALLHGDLWYGNYMAGPDGSAWLIDPAVYVGHPEADIAMTELFGGFPEEFYRAYFGDEGRPEGYEERKNIYNLYHMLNHLNLFGAAYIGTVRQMINIRSLD